MTPTQATIVTAVIILELAAAIYFLYKADIIEYVRQEIEIEKGEKSRHEDIDTLIEDALRADSQRIN